MPTPVNPPIDIEAIHALVTVSERGSAQAAAKALGVSRATIRRRLDDLEATAGVALLHRDASGARLTPAGMALVERGRYAVEAAHGALEAARLAASSVSGVVRVVIPVGMQMQLAAQLLDGARLTLPGLRIVVVERSDPVAYTGEFEVMLHFGPPPTDDRLYSRVLRRAPVSLFASPTYLAAHGAPEDPAALAAHPLFVWQGGTWPASRLPLRAGGGVEVEPWLVTPNINLIRRLAALGGGIGFAPDGGIPDEDGVGPLVPLLAEVGVDDALRVTSPLPSRVDPRTAAVAQRVYDLLNAWPEPEP